MAWYSLPQRITQPCGFSCSAKKKIQRITNIAEGEGVINGIDNPEYGSATIEKYGLMRLDPCGSPQSGLALFLNQTSLPIGLDARYSGVARYQHNITYR